MHHPKNNFMSKQRLIQPLQREIYNKLSLISQILVRSKNLWSRITLYRVCTYVFGLSTLWLKQRRLDLSIICMWSPADVCEQWERNYLPFGSAEVRGPGTRDKPLRMSVWEARAFKQALYLGESWEVTHELHMKGDECVRDGNMRLPRSHTIVLLRFTSLTYIIGELAHSLLKILRGPPNP